MLTGTGTKFNKHMYGGKFGYYSEGGMGLILAGQRWYSSFVMKWLSRDPIRYGGGDNLYGYVLENPVMYEDANGLNPSATECMKECLSEYTGLELAGGAGMVIAGRRSIPTRGKFRGMDNTTSVASKVLRSLFKQKIPRTFGTSVLGGALGRCTPIVGWALVIDDVVNVTTCQLTCQGVVN